MKTEEINKKNAEKSRGALPKLLICQLLNAL